MELRLEKEINSSQESCYKAFTEPLKLSEWFTTNAIGDLRVGGRYTNDDKDEGEYLELKPFEKIKFTWENEEHCPNTTVEVEFVNLDVNKTKVVLTHSKLETREHLNDMKIGWTWALTCVKSFLETGKRIPYSEWEKTIKK